MHGGDNSAAGAGDFLVGAPLEAHLEFPGPVAAPDQVRVAVDERRRDQAASEVDPGRRAEGRRQVGPRSAPADHSVPANGDRAIRDHPVGGRARLQRRDVGVLENSGFHGRQPPLDWTGDRHYVCTY